MNANIEPDRRGDHRRARQGAVRRARARCSAGSRSWSSPAGSRSCSRASSPPRSPPAWTSTPSASRSASCAGITPFNFPAMVPMWMFPVAIACGNTFVLKPSERDPSASLIMAELWPRPGCPMASSTSCTATRRPSTGCSTTRTWPRSRSSGRPRSRSTSTSGPAANGKRVQALGGAKNHAIILPDADLDYASDQLVAAAFGSAGERCMAISAAVAVGGAGDAWSQGRQRQGAAVRSAPGRDGDERDGSGGHARGPRPDRRADRRRASSRARRSSVDGRGLDGGRAERRLLRRPDRHRPGDARHGRLHARRSSVRCCPWSAWTTSTTAID